MADEADPRDRTDTALGVLRDIWGAGAQSSVDVEEFTPDRHLPSTRACRKTAMLGIKGMEDEGMAEAMRGEWKRQLATEGKLRPGAGTVRDLIEKPTETSEQPPNDNS